MARSNDGPEPVFAFQAKAEIFNLAAAMKVSTLDTWEVEIRKKLIHESLGPGQRVFFFVPGKRGGLHGAGHILTSPTSMPHYEKTLTFFGDEAEIPDMADRVWVSYAKLREPISRAKLLEHKLIKEHFKVVRGVQGINFWVVNPNSTQAEIQTQQEVHDLLESLVDGQLEEGGMAANVPKSACDLVDSRLRNLALKNYGYDCMACEFNFQAYYGPLAVEAAEIHNTKELDEASEKIFVKDLVVLCPNCHRLLHTHQPEIPWSDLVQHFDKQREMEFME